jgi:two-component system response regulator NreC
VSASASLGPSGPETITIVVADELAMVRAGLRMLLEAEADLTVVSEAEDADGARRELAGLQPSVLILDAGAHGGGLRAIPQLRDAAPQTGIVVLGADEQPETARAALRAGTRAYVLKRSGPDALLEAVRAAAGAKTYVDPLIASGLGGDQPPGDGFPDGLSGREVEVFRLLASGHTNAEIAGQLYLSVRTVESHRAHIQQKTGCSSRAALVAYARERSLI